MDQKLDSSKFCSQDGDSDDDFDLASAYSDVSEDEFDSDEDDNEDNDSDSEAIPEEIVVCPPCNTKKSSSNKKIHLKKASEIRAENRVTEFLSTDSIKNIITANCCSNKCFRSMCPEYNNEGIDRPAFELIWNCRNDIKHALHGREKDLYLRRLISGKRFE